jgi:hypothetical protein
VRTRDIKGISKRNIQDREIKKLEMALKVRKRVRDKTDNEKVKRRER